MRQRLLYILYTSDLYGTRFLLGLAELIWAIALLWPGDTFGRPTYHVMQQSMISWLLWVQMLVGIDVSLWHYTEEVWGALFLVTGVSQWWLLYHMEFHSRRAVAFALCNTALWTYCVVSMYLSVFPPPAAISGEFALAVGSAWIFVRSGWPYSKRPYRRAGDAAT